MNELAWDDNGWTYTLTPDGHMWRFRGEHTYTDDQGEIHVLRPDFGAIPGGAYVAIERLVRASAVQRRRYAVGRRGRGAT